MPRRFAIVACDPGTVDPGLGPAVLHYRRGQTHVYCPRDTITTAAACVVAGLAGQVIDGGTPPGPRIAITAAGHFELPRHPAMAVIRGHDVTIAVCSDLITAELAEVLGLLCTAQAGYLSGCGPAAARISPAG
jgi:hypothetical protein